MVWADPPWPISPHLSVSLWPRRRAGIDAVYVVVVATPQSEQPCQAEQAEPSQIHPILIIVGDRNLPATLPHRLCRIPSGLGVPRRGCRHQDQQGRENESSTFATKTIVRHGTILRE